MILMNHRTVKVTWKHIQTKYKIWPGKGKAVCTHPRDCRGVFYFEF